MVKVTKQTTTPTTRKSKIVKRATVKHIGIVAHDPFLEEYEAAIMGRHNFALQKKKQLTKLTNDSLSDFAMGYTYFGLHKTDTEWVFRDWAPNATAIYLIGDFNHWEKQEKFKAKRIKGTDNWELKLPLHAIKHEQLYKLIIEWDGGEGERIPAWDKLFVE